MNIIAGDPICPCAGNSWPLSSWLAVVVLAVAIVVGVWTLGQIFPPPKREPDDDDDEGGP